MIIKLANLWVDFLLRANQEIEEEDKAVYLYGAECFINEAISDLLLLIGGLITGHLFEVFLWTVSFTALRVNLGGYHAPSHFLCITSSTILGLFSIIVNPFWIHYPYLTTFLLLLSTLAVFLMAPVLHANRPIPVPERKKIKIRATVITLIELLIIFIFRSHASVSASFTSGLLFAVILGILGLLLNPKESKES